MPTSSHVEPKQSLANLTAVAHILLRGQSNTAQKKAMELSVSGSTKNESDTLLWEIIYGKSRRK